jgi:C4-type Zn-finger protein
VSEGQSEPNAATTIANIACPRCHQACGWCGDYRHIHGQLKMPGTKRRCDLPLRPEGADCPICQGDLRVRAITHYERISA